MNVGVMCSQNRDRGQQQRHGDRADRDAGDGEPAALLMGPIDLAERDDAEHYAGDGER